MIKGIDVSHWQDDKSTPQKMDFAKAKAQGAEFVFIKVSERGGIDRDFEYNWASAKAAGLLRGGYHFLRWDLSGTMQARIFCDIMKDDPGELPPVADFEAPPKFSNSTTISHYPSNSLLEQFLIEVETLAKRKPMIYTSPGYWKVHGRNKITKVFEQKWKYYPLWIAHYFKTYTPGVTKPMTIYPWGEDTWLFWQHSANGDGIAHGAESKNLDLNWFNGSLEDLYRLAEKPIDDPPVPPVPPAPPNSDVEKRLLKLEDWVNSYGP